MTLIEKGDPAVSTSPCDPRAVHTERGHGRAATAPRGTLTRVSIDTAPAFPTGMSDLLQARLIFQACAFTRADALELGCTDSQLRTWCRSGELRTPGYGAYYLPAPAGAHPPGPPTDVAVGDEFSVEREEAVRRIRSIVLTMDESVIVTHESALLLRGLPVWAAAHSTVVHLSQHGSRKRTRRRGVSRHVAPLELTTSLIGNVRVASPAWAVAQTCCTLGIESTVVAADAALRSGVLDPKHLLTVCTALIGTRGSAPLTSLLRLVDGRSESPGESRLRLLLDGAGFDVTPQRVIHDESGHFVARVDLAVDNSRVLIEFDGMLKYRGAANEGALVAEKRRELTLIRLGYTVVRITWGDLDHPGRVLSLLRTALGNDKGHIFR